MTKTKINDEWMTLEYGVKPILKYIRPNSTIWCPFDREDSQFLKVLEQAGHKVYISHIVDCQDFFESWRINKFDKNIYMNVEGQLEEWSKVDYIISNPPFSLRKQVIDHLFKLDVPFAMIVPLVSIALKNIRLKLEQCEILAFDKRMKFKAVNGMVCKNPPSETIYLCHKVLPKQIIIESLEEK